jgi:hypothetical protein
MHKSKIFDFDLEIYNARVHVFHNSTDEEVKNYIFNLFPDAVYDRPKNNSATAFVFEHESYGEQYAIDFIIPLKRNNPESHKTISHEASHTTYEICNSRGIKCDYYNQETFAYILGYIVKKINEGVFL